jgi:2-polyprenyl-6-methoxyphenol hydroxylase-like FAD-dependent oxidoreductase
LSLGILKKLGVWDLVEQKEVSLLKEAKVFDGDSPSLLNFRSATSGIEALGYLVPNYQLRQALYHRVQQAENITVMTDALVEDVASHESHSDVLFADGKTIVAKLVIGNNAKVCP